MKRRNTRFPKFCDCQDTPRKRRRFRLRAASLSDFEDGFNEGVKHGRADARSERR